MYSMLLTVMLSVGMSALFPMQTKDGMQKLVSVFSQVKWEASQQEIKKLFSEKKFTASGTFEGMRTIGYYDTLDRDTVLISFHFTKENKLIRLDVAFLVKGEKKVHALSNKWKEALTRKYGVPATLGEAIFLWVADQDSILVLGITPQKELGIQYWQKTFFFQLQQLRLRQQK